MRVSCFMRKVSFVAAVQAWMVLLTVVTVSAAALSIDKQKVPVRAIISFKQVDNGPVVFADMLEGLDYSQNPAKYTDTKTGCIKVGMFARCDPDGTNESLRYDEKVLYPDVLKMSDGNIRRCDKEDVRFMLGSLKLVRKGVWLEDLVNIYQRKLKYAKNERDKELKQRRLSRLYNWCNSNFLYRYAEKLTKELRRLEKLEADIEEEEGELLEIEEIDPEALSKEITAAFKALPGAGDVVVRSSLHIVIASDHIPEKTMNRLLQLGERVIKDFSGFMYDQGDDLGQPIPNEEILRIFSFSKLNTFESALKNASTLSRCGNMSRQNEIVRTLKMGGMNFENNVGRKVLRTSLGCNERGDPAEPGSIKEAGRDHNDHLVHQLGHTLIANRLRTNSARGSGRLAMPWLSEGMAIFLSIKHLGTKNTACVDFPEEKSRYASQGQKKKKKNESWFGDIEGMVTSIALDDTADNFEDMIRVPHFSKMKPETVAKAFSMIDFLVRIDRVGFLTFIDTLQKHYKEIYQGKDLRKFVNGLDPMIADSFAGAVVKSGRKTVPLDSVDALEQAWKDWAAKYVLSDKHR